MKLTLVLVHGIGNSRKNWAEKIIPALEIRLQSKLKSFANYFKPTSKVLDIICQRVAHD